MNYYTTPICLQLSAEKLNKQTELKLDKDEIIFAEKVEFHVFRK